MITDQNITPLQTKDNKADDNKAVGCGDDKSMACCCCCNDCVDDREHPNNVQDDEEAHVNNITMVNPNTVAKKSNDKNVVKNETIVKTIVACNACFRRCSCCCSLDPGSLLVLLIKENIGERRNKTHTHTHTTKIKSSKSKNQPVAKE